MNLWYSFVKISNLILNYVANGSVECRWLDPQSGQAVTAKLTPVVSLVSFHHLRVRAGLVSPVSV